MAWSRAEGARFWRGRERWSFLADVVVIAGSFFGSHFKVQSSKFKVRSSKLKAQSSNCKLQSSKFKVGGWGSGLVALVSEGPHGRTLDVAMRIVVDRWSRCASRKLFLDFWGCDACGGRKFKSGWRLGRGELT